MAEKDDAVVEAPPLPPGSQPQLSVTMKGGANEVIKQLNGGQGKSPADPNAIPPGVKGDGEYTVEGFIKALSDPYHVVRAKRQSPKTNDFGEKIDGEVYRTECPTTLQDIKDDIEKDCGGKKFRVTVEDSRNGKIVAALRLEIEKDPVLPFNMEPLPEKSSARRSHWGLPIGAPDPEIAKLDKEIQIAERDEEIAKRQIRIDNLRGGPKQGSDPEVLALKQQLAMMRDRELDAKQREIERLTALASAPKAPAGESETAKMLTQLMVEMREDRKAADARFEKLIERQNAEKSDAILRELTELRKAPMKSDEDFIEKLIKFKKAMKLLDGDGGDDDDDEPKEWYEILIKEGIPQLVDLIKSKKGEGKAMTREELLRDMDKEVDAAVRKAAERHNPGNLPAPVQPPGLPAPVQPPAPVHQGQMVVPPVVVQQPVAAPPVVAPVVPPPVASPASVPPVVAPAAVSAPPAPANQMLTVQQEISMRVGNVLLIIEQEANIRPRDSQWSAIAWDTLPEDFVEALVKVEEPSGMPAVFGAIVPAEKVLQLSALFAQEKQAAFLRRGLSELKDWVAKVKADPDFDPFAEEEEEAE